MALNTLGCGRYSAQVWTRGGADLLFADLPVTQVSWDRRLDDTSQASVTLAGLGRSAACFAAIRDANAWQHELAIARDGAVVWQGPIVTSNSQGVQGSYDARDVSAWWDHRKERVDREFVLADLATIFQTLADDAMLADPSPNITVSTTPTSVLGSRKYLAGQHLLIGTQLRELSTAGVDWTVVGRDVLAGGIVVPASPIVRLNDQHLVAPPKVTKDGLAMATFVTTLGAGGGEGAAPVFGEASDADAIATFGLLDSVSSNDSIRDSTSAAATSASTLAISDVPVVQASEVGIDNGAPITIDQLVPGALIDVAWRTSGIEVAGTFRLSKVAVTGQGGAESVTITIQPIGATGSDG